MDHVDAMILEPFDLHSSEPLCHHSPNDYLSSNFRFYPSDHQELEIANDKTENDVDALWTRAVDNMFKSSRLFNGSNKEEEKENLAENVMENVMEITEKQSQGRGDIIEKEFEKETQGLFVDNIKKIPVETVAENANMNLLSNDAKQRAVVKAEDQIVPFSAKSGRKHSSKRKHQDTDVNFDLIIANSLPPSVVFENKRIKLEPMENTDSSSSRGDLEIHDRWSMPPKNCIIADYHFDSSARLPSFREAFVPAIKKITRREKELRRNLKNREILGDRQVSQDKSHREAQTGPVRRHQDPESRESRFGDIAGDVLLEPTGHPAVQLSERNQLEQFSTAEASKTRASAHKNAQENAGHSVAETGNITHIKQEKNDEFLQCAKPLTYTSTTETPSKLFGLNSASLKDIEKNIFSFDEGLEMLELDKDFHDIPDQDCDWPFEISSVARDISDQHAIGQNVPSNAGHLISSQVVAHSNAMLDGSDVIDSSLQLSGCSNIAHSNSLSSFSHSRPLSGMDLINIDPTMHLNVLKQEQPGNNAFDMLGHVEQVQHKDFPPNITHPNQLQFNNPNSLDGQIIAQQIHQSFGADIFGPPGDNGAKILAKYLAQRGSVRSGDPESKVNVTSAIASLISKSFDEQEATQKMSQRDSIDFINSSELEHFDFMNDQF